MVIQIPNPLLLPQSYGMGEVAGMGFGSNYVMMMQIVYNYYAPRVIKEMEDGKLDSPMGTQWWRKWQVFMTKYSDQSINNTMDRILEIPENILDKIWEKMSGAPKDVSDITDTSALQLGEIFEARYTPSRDREGDREKTDKLIADAIKQLQDAYEYGSQLTNPKPTGHNQPKPRLTFAELKKTADYQRSLREQKKADQATARAVSAIKPSLVKRLAGQSQKQQRNLHITGIRARQYTLSYYQNAIRTGKIVRRSGLQNANLQIAKAKVDIQTIQRKLTVLLSRYRFT